MKEADMDYGCVKCPMYTSTKSIGGELFVSLHRILIVAFPRDQRQLSNKEKTVSLGGSSNFLYAPKLTPRDFRLFRSR